MNTTRFECEVISAHPCENGGFTFANFHYTFIGTRFGAIKYGILKARLYGAVEIRRVNVLNELAY